MLNIAIGILIVLVLAFVFGEACAALGYAVALLVFLARGARRVWSVLW